MGLDMYAFATTTALTTSVDFAEPETVEQLHYWRKHWKLHDWMRALYLRNGGADPDFNMSGVVLTSRDLGFLTLALLLGYLTDDGSFVRISDGAEQEGDLAFIAKARAAIAAGKTVYYVAWW